MKRLLAISLRWIAMILAIAGIVIALAASHGSAAGGSNANTPVALDIEHAIRVQLDRMFYPEQYVLDIQKRTTQVRAPEVTATPVVQWSLPGLSLFSPRIENGFYDASGRLIQVPQAPLAKAETTAYDILIVFDKSVTTERRTIAEKLVRRILASHDSSATFALEVTRGDILRIMPQALKENLQPLPPPTTAPVPAQAQADWNDDEEETPPETATARPADAGSPAPRPLLGGGATEITAKVQGDMGSFGVKDIMLLAWGLVTTGVLVFMFLKKGVSSAASSLFPSNFQATIKNEGAAAKNEPVETMVERANARADEELHEKRIMKLRQELMQEAQEDPRRIAKVLTTWASSSDELSKQGRLFFMNCDMKTINLVCSAMSPSDLQAIYAHRLDQFHPLSEENERALESLRAALALQASGLDKETKESPLDFLRRIGEDDLAAILHGEPLEVIAKIGTQLPPARLQRFYTSLGHDDLLKLSLLMTETKGLAAEAFVEIKERLTAKLAHLDNSLVSENSLVRSLVQLIHSMPHPEKQLSIALCLSQGNRDIYPKVRERVILPIDLDNFPEPAIKLLIQEIEADEMAQALCHLKHDFKRLAGFFPETYQLVFVDELSRDHSDNEREKAWKNLSTAIRGFVESGVITYSDLALARKKSLDVEKAMTHKDDSVSPVLPEPQSGEVPNVAA